MQMLIGHGQVPTIMPEASNLLIISHIDQDHINGIKALLKENENSNSPKIIQIDEVWFNFQALG